MGVTVKLSEPGSDLSLKQAKNGVYIVSWSTADYAPVGTAIFKYLGRVHYLNDFGGHDGDDLANIRVRRLRKGEQVIIEAD